MQTKNKDSQKTIINLELLNSLNEEGCPACGNKFTLGEPVVLACGDWGSSKKLIHENEAIFDKQSGSFIEQNCFRASANKL